MSLKKKCRHAVGLTGEDRLTAWKRCGCTWVADITIDGSRKWITLGPAFEAARKEHARLTARRAVGEPVAQRPLSDYALEAAAARWWRMKEPRLAPNTVGGYKDSIRLMNLTLPDADVRAVTPTTITAMESGLLRGGYSAGTVGNVRTVLIQTLRHAHAEGLIDNVPKPSEPLSRVTDEPPVLRPDEIQRALTHIDRAWLPITEFTYLTGLRSGEALAVEDTAIRSGVLTVEWQILQRTGERDRPKGGKVRDVDLSPRALEIASGRTGVLWPGSYTPWLRRWHDALSLAGLPQLGLHVLRHSNVALRFAAGQTPAYVARQLGHSSAAFTLRRYGRWIPSERDDPGKLDAMVTQLSPLS